MLFKIIKKAPNSFWHLYNNGSKEVNLSDFEVVLDSMAQTFNIQCLNGANVPNQSVQVADIRVIDQTAGSFEETFPNVLILKNRLTTLGYTPYKSTTGIEEAPVDGNTYGRKDEGWDIITDGVSQLVALPFTTNHLTATGNQYTIGDVVYYIGNVYRCIAINDSILPTNISYWTNLGVGNPLVQQPTDWNATSGNNQILNKPTIQNNQTLAEVLIEGNETDGENIVINNADAIELENTSLLKKGTYNFGGNGGISRICSNNYEDMWQNGFRHVFDQSGFIRNSTNCFDIIPDETFDDTLRFKVGSIWTLDNGTSYVCIDSTTGAAEWELANEISLQKVLDFNHDLVGGKNFQGSGAGLAASGVNINAFGTGAAGFNTGSNVNGFGTNILSGNSGDYVNAFGEQAGGGNTFNNINLLGQNATADENGQTVLSKDGTIMARISTADLTETRKYNLPNADGILALTTDVTTPTLQEVTDAGAETTNSITAIQLVTNTNGTYKKMTLSSNNVDGERTAEWQNKDYVGIADITDIPAAQVNSDWNATSGVEEILNKPTIPTNTSDLTNDGADGVNPFITALDIPTTGQASTLVREVKNMTGATLTKGTVVYISGANGNKALVSKAIATTDALSARTFGLLQSNISNNGLGYCVIIGDLSGLDTSAFTEGDQLYLSGVTAGTYTATKILAPTHLVYVGKVTRSHPTLGQIEVGIQNGYEISEIHDIAINGLANNQLLSYDSATSLWKNKSVTTADIASSTNKNYVTDAQATVISNTSGTNTGDNSTNTNSNSYSDAKVSDTITDGVTTIAPSQNAVFDALALKQNALGYTPYRFTKTTEIVHTGTTAETILQTILIPANTFTNGDFIMFSALVSKLANISNTTHNIKINTTNTLVGASTIALIGFNTVNFFMKFKREFVVNGGNIYGYTTALGTPNDQSTTTTTQVVNTATYNLSADLYLFVTCTLTNLLDTITYRGINFYKQ